MCSGFTIFTLKTKSVLFSKLVLPSVIHVSGLFLVRLSFKVYECSRNVNKSATLVLQFLSFSYENIIFIFHDKGH